MKGGRIEMIFGRQDLGGEECREQCHRRWKGCWGLNGLFGRGTPCSDRPVDCPGHREASAVLECLPICFVTEARSELQF